MYREELRAGELESVGYDPINRILEVELRNHTIFQYQRVSPKVYSQLMRAGAPWDYFRHHVKYLFPGKRVR